MIQYTTDNFITSLVQSLSQYALANGHDVHWYSTGQVITHSGLISRTTLTFVPAFPAEPRFISRLKGESVGLEDILVPALTLYSPAHASRTRVMGIGHLDSEWARSLVIEAVTETDAQQRELCDLFQSWLMEVPNKLIPAFDYTIPTAPVALFPLYVQDALVTPMMLDAPINDVKYVVRVDAEMFYFE